MLSEMELAEVTRRGPTKILLTIEDAAEALSVSRATLYRLMTRRDLFSVKVGGARRIPMKALHEYVESLGRR